MKTCFHAEMSFSLLSVSKTEVCKCGVQQEDKKKIKDSNLQSFEYKGLTAFELESKVMSKKKEGFI